MKIIDEKGRLFGRINIIDFLVMLILCGAIPLFYLGYRILNKHVVIVEAPKEIREIEINAKFIKLKPETLALLAVGDREMDQQGQVIGRVTWLGTGLPYRYSFDLGQGRTIMADDLQLKEIEAKLIVAGEVRDGCIFYKGQRVNLGSSFEFKSEKYNVQAIPMADLEIVQTKEKHPVWLDLDVTFVGLDDKVVMLISAGDKELSADGSPIAEIIKTGKVGNQNYDLFLGDSFSANAEDVSHKQVTVKLRMMTMTADEKNFFFKNSRITKESPISFITDKYAVAGRLARSFEAPVVPLTEKWLKVKIRFSDLMPELIRVIREGDVEKNASGKIVGKLGPVLANKPSDVLIVQDNKMVNIANPFTKDIEVFFSLLCVEKEGVLCYRNYPVKMGNPIIFSTDIYSISGVVIGIEG